MKKHSPLACTAAGLMSLALAGAVHAQTVSNDVVKIGLLNDQSGLFADMSGKMSIEAVKMAIDDFGGKVLGKPIQLVSADHQNKVDIGLAIARKWYEQEGVDMILDVPNSAIALGVQELTKQMNRVAIFTSPGTSDLTGKACSPNGVHWTYDTYAYASGAASGVMAEGGKSWFFITSDYAFGHALERDASAVVKAQGGQVLGAIRHPIGSSDFSSYLVQAQASKAQVIGLANGSADTINTMKQAREFGIGTGKQRIAALYMGINDVHSMGLAIGQDINLVEAFYWDQSPQSRQWSERFYKVAGRMPSGVQASNYAATLHYLKAVQAAGTDEAGAVMKKMHEMKINDLMTKDGTIREDGRVMRDLYLYKIKKPSESKRPWDYYTVVRTIPAQQAFKAPDPACPLVKK
ncbi:ABC transporter substrate-binding protein [uncultured Pseudacidovorax sp.]|uniref:ABC transporter substrate-binding protein n=1 Tax=uncultured Pseudacidovorax sp. TaxID=679313 RepID=UPI0025E8836D|nr:ABC transporter substrate-binding protein [uncultured Pseudacidovorax sp.]